MTDWRASIAVALALLIGVHTFVLLKLEERLHRLEIEVRHLAGRPTIPEFETVAGTGNVHRRKLGWRVKLVIWWVGVRERMAKWRP